MSATLRKRALLFLVLSLSILSSCSRETTKSISGKRDSNNIRTGSVNANKDFGESNAYDRKAGLIRGNKRSMIYHWPGCPNYDEIAPHNRIPFRTEEDAERAGYRAARNCD